MLRPVMAHQQQAAVGLPVEMNTTVFVRGIPREATTQSVESHFRVHGEILSCHVIRHKDASTNKGIAFVKFREAAAAQRAINGNHPGIMENREVFAEWAHPRPATSARPVPDQHIPPPPVYFPFPRLVPSFPAPYQVLGFPAYFPIEQPPHTTTHLPGPSSSSQTHPSSDEQVPPTTNSRKGKEKET